MAELLHVILIVLTILVIVVPLFVLVWLGGKVVGLLQRMAKPLDDLLPMDTVWGVVVADAIAVALLLVICFVGGLLTRFSFARRFVKKAEQEELIDRAYATR